MRILLGNPVANRYPDGLLRIHFDFLRLSSILSIIAWSCFRISLFSFSDWLFSARRRNTSPAHVTSLAPFSTTDIDIYRHCRHLNEANPSHLSAAFLVTNF